MYHLRQLQKKIWQDLGWQAKTQRASCRKLVGHFLVCGSFIIKHHTISADDIPLKLMLTEAIARVWQYNLAKSMQTKEKGTCGWNQVSLSMYHWVYNALTGKSRLNTKAATSEMLIGRRLGMLNSVMSLSWKDGLTRVLQRWFSIMQKGIKPKMPLCACHRRAKTQSNDRFFLLCQKWQWSLWFRTVRHVSL